MFEIRIAKDKCKGCGLCIVYCKEEVLCVSPDINEKGYYPVKVRPEKECVGCRNCYVMCPDGVIEIYQEK